MIVRPAEYMAEPPTGAMLESVVREHIAGVARLDKLKDMYDNRHDILNRARQKGLPNNKLTHGFAWYIVTMASGYLIGKPIDYQAQDANAAAFETLMDTYKRFDIDSVDAELAKDAGTYGRAVELVFADESASPRSASLEPQTAFVVYDDSALSNPLFGVYISARMAADGTSQGFSVRVYTSAAVYRYDVDSFADLKSALPVSVEPHYFGAVPMVEYWNNDGETGDFEQVMSLIDAYDTLQSDRINDKQQFVDALLVLTGVRMENDEKNRTPGQQLREDKVLSLPDPECKAEYLARAMTEADVEILKDALKADIHKFSFVPDLTDEQFAGNASGVAMRFKLLGLEQLMRIKERWFREALRSRLRLFAHFLAVKGNAALDADSVTMTFTRSLPVNELEVAQTVQAYSGLVPDELLLSQVPFVSDVQAALDKLAEQKENEVKRQRETFGGYGDVSNANAEDKMNE